MLTPYHTKINSKQSIYLNVKLKTIKHLKENFCDLGLGKDSSDIIKAQALKGKKFNKLDFTKTTFTLQSIKKWKRKATDWKQIIINNYLIKDLIQII